MENEISVNETGAKKSVLTCLQVFYVFFFLRLTNTLRNYFLPSTKGFLIVQKSI